MLTCQIKQAQKLSQLIPLWICRCYDIVQRVADEALCLLWPALLLLLGKDYEHWPALYVTALHKYLL